MQLHHVKPAHKLKKRRRISRGGKRGGYSGRGIKGQKSRAGAGIRPAIRDMMMKLPKQRGRAKHAFKSLYEKPAILNLVDVNKRFKEGDIVSPKTLNLSQVKILGKGEINKKLHFQNILFSKSASEKIKKAGGTIKP
ncbi:MAG: 50S ribosomal protein L15 [Candidatus Azambacteria bacterium GW2011_GWA2_39_10]|uniref:Large ribosomal subunit protein uL15 n=1 Tax=Candidatus Azambacteria bacterium GW2011_GWA2_39_10 TaxID=1618611 RepID=A0A0G0LT50_9BACT|nr:MAG: 50S ribosomal protein L15 [Candidatus Azambacteria bacterium GW2011_GWA2_39_10]